MARLRNILFTALMWALFCTAQIYASPETNPRGIASIGSRLGNAFNGAGKSLGGVVNGVGRGVGKTVGGLGQSVNHTTKGIGQLIEDSGEVVLEVADAAIKVAIVAGVVFLFIEAEHNGYYDHHYHDYRYRDYGR